MNKKRKLSQKTIVITGASSGAGRAMAIEFAQQETKLVLAARNKEALKEVAKECEQLGAHALVVETDVTKFGDLINLADAAHQFGKQIDVWINNAGILAFGPFEDMPMEVHDQVIRTNLLGYMNGAHAVIPYFKRQGFGVLINNISIGGYLVLPFGAAYSASKFGLRGFVKALQAELTNWKAIHVCAVFPAFLDTPGMRHAANYTNKLIQPIPPLYNPIKLAKKMVDLAARPKASSDIHLFAKGLKSVAFLAPNLVLWATRGMLNRYLKQAENAEKTDGNLFYPLSFGTGINGGWQQLQRYKLKPATVFSLILSLSVLVRVCLKRSNELEKCCN